MYVCILFSFLQTHFDNALVTFADSVQVLNFYLTARGSEGGDEEVQGWKELASLIDMMGSVNDLICEKFGSKMTGFNATEIVQPEEDDATSVKEIWGLPISGDLIIHPMGLRCSKCSAKAKGRGQKSCLSVSHAKALIANVAVRQLRRRKGKHQSLPKLLR